MLISITVCSNAQRVRLLKRVVDKESRNYKSAMIYGVFVQRLGFSSGGFAQFVQLYNLDSQKYYRLQVKEPFTSAKENFFCAELPIGKYEIRSYNYVRSKWYGGMIYEEPIFKNFDASDTLNSNSLKDSTKALSLERFTFVVTDVAPYYVGLWDFNSGLVKFSSNKEDADEKLKRLIHISDGSNAISILPE
jgi:hypothetical protein